MVPIRTIILFIRAKSPIRIKFGTVIIFGPNYGMQLNIFDGTYISIM